MDTLTLYAIVFVGVLVCLEWWSSHGRCRKCNNERQVRCGCDPDRRRKPWRNSGR